MRNEPLLAGGHTADVPVEWLLQGWPLTEISEITSTSERVHDGRRVLIDLERDLVAGWHPHGRQRDHRATRRPAAQSRPARAAGTAYRAVTVTTALVALARPAVAADVVW
jgi:hypothetical protein